MFQTQIIVYAINQKIFCDEKNNSLKKSINLTHNI
jgi:hypothetical protein